MRQRTAAADAAFFLPHLRRGARVLDVGCGPGSITVGLAEAVAPGEVIGVDAEPLQIERAEALAEGRALANLRFEVANAYELPYPDASFDARYGIRSSPSVGLISTPSRRCALNSTNGPSDRMPSRSRCVASRSRGHESRARQPWRRECAGQRCRLNGARPRAECAHLAASRRWLALRGPGTAEASDVCR